MGAVLQLNSVLRSACQCQSGGALAEANVDGDENDRRGTSNRAKPHAPIFFFFPTTITVGNRDHPVSALGEEHQLQPVISFIDNLRLFPIDL